MGIVAGALYLKIRYVSYVIFGKALDEGPHRWSLERVSMPALFHYQPNVATDIRIFIVSWATASHHTANNGKVVLEMEERQPPGEYFEHRHTKGPDIRLHRDLWDNFFLLFRKLH